MHDLTVLGTTENEIEFHQRRALLMNEGDRGHSQARPWLEDPSPYSMGTRLPKIQQQAQAMGQVGDGT